MGKERGWRGQTREGTRRPWKRSLTRPTRTDDNKLGDRGKGFFQSWGMELRGVAPNGWVKESGSSLRSRKGWSRKGEAQVEVEDYLCFCFVKLISIVAPSPMLRASIIDRLGLIHRLLLKSRFSLLLLLLLLFPFCGPPVGNRKSLWRQCPPRTDWSPPQCRLCTDVSDVIATTHYHQPAVAMYESSWQKRSSCCYTNPFPPPPPGGAPAIDPDHQDARVFRFWPLFRDWKSTVVVVFFLHHCL